MKISLLLCAALGAAPARAQSLTEAFERSIGLEQAAKRAVAAAGQSATPAAATDQFLAIGSDNPGLNRIAGFQLSSVLPLHENHDYGAPYFDPSRRTPYAVVQGGQTINAPDIDLSKPFCVLQAQRADPHPPTSLAKGSFAARGKASEAALYWSSGRRERLVVFYADDGHDGVRVSCRFPQNASVATDLVANAFTSGQTRLELRP